MTSIPNAEVLGTTTALASPQGAPTTPEVSVAPDATRITTAIEPSSSGPWQAIDQLLRNPLALVAELESGRSGVGLVRLLIVIILCGGATFGAAVGGYHGGWQIAAAAVKVPLVLLLTGCVAASTLTVLRRSLQGTGQWRGDLGLVLACLARGGLVQLAVAPILLLARALEMTYHQSVLLTAGAFALSGLVAVALFVRVLWRGPASGRATVAGVFLVVFGLILAQLAWTGRPYLVRPRDPDPPMMRAVEGSPWDALIGTLRSAGGDYWRESAPLRDR